jgi:hypothetical protein
MQLTWTRPQVLPEHVRNAGSHLAFTQSRQGADAESDRHSLKHDFMPQARLVALQLAHAGDSPIVFSKHGLEQVATSGSLKQDSPQLCVLLAKSLASMAALSFSPVQPPAAGALALAPPLPACALAPAAGAVLAAALPACGVLVAAISVGSLADVLGLAASDHLFSVQ